MKLQKYSYKLGVFLTFFTDFSKPMKAKDMKLIIEREYQTYKQDVRLGLPIRGPQKCEKGDLRDTMPQPVGNGSCYSICTGCFSSYTYAPIYHLRHVNDSNHSVTRVLLTQHFRILFMHMMCKRVQANVIQGLYMCTYVNEYIINA